jgi:hypothetical protein
VAEALDLVVRCEDRSRRFQRALEDLAEAQSALRRSLKRVNINDDDDQREVYEWLRATAARHRVYLRRHMRAEDLADPSEWRSLLARIEESATAGRRHPRETSLLEEIRSHQAAIRQGDPAEDDWSALIDAVEELIGAGTAPSSRELRDLLLPIVENLPDRDDLPGGFRRALREVDRFLATRQPRAPAQPHAKPSAEVDEIARLLAGKSLVLIGGRRRRDAQESLEKAFGLKSVFWIETREHESYEGFEPMIARPEVALVLLAIRWSSHGFGEVRHLCERYAKPLVRLPGGYGPNQVAAQILSQCSHQLECSPTSMSRSGESPIRGID